MTLPALARSPQRRPEAIAKMVVDLVRIVALLQHISTCSCSKP